MLLQQPGSAALSGSLAPQYSTMFPEFNAGMPAAERQYANNFPEGGGGQQLAHDQGALNAGSDVLAGQWADASDEVDLGDLFLGISMDDTDSR